MEIQSRYLEGKDLSYLLNIVNYKANHEEFLGDFLYVIFYASYRLRKMAFNAFTPENNKRSQTSSLIITNNR